MNSCKNRFLVVVVVIFNACSLQSMFCREVDLHAGSSGSCDAAADGHEPAADSAHEDCDSVAGHVPETHRICHEHHAATHYQAGNITVLCPFSVYSFIALTPLAGRQEEGHLCCKNSLSITLHCQVSRLDCAEELLLHH